MTIAHYALIPRDGFFCKDGRGWSTVTEGHGHALDWPHPSTLLGALRSAWGRALEEHEHRAITDWQAETAPIRLARTLALYREWQREEWQPMWPTPNDLRIVKVEGADQIEWLEPRPPTIRTIGRDGDASHPREQLWTARSETRGKPQPRPRWWSHHEFVQWLTQPTQHAAPPKDIRLTRRRQTHVSIGPSSHTASDGALFSHDVVETFDHEGEWAIGCELDLPREVPPSQALVGSDRRLATIKPLPASLFAIPDAVFTAIDGAKGLRLITITPTDFVEGWLPDGLHEVTIDGKREYRGKLPGLDCELILRAALVDRHLPVSGWDMHARAPKPTSRMVAPGSVYAFERADRQAFEAGHARALWLAALGQRQHEGFGRVVPGVWHPRT